MFGCSIVSWFFSFQWKRSRLFQGPLLQPTSLWRPIKFFWSFFVKKFHLSHFPGFWDGCNSGSGFKLGSIAAKTNPRIISLHRCKKMVGQVRKVKKGPLSLVLLFSGPWSSALDITVDCIYEIHRLALDGFDLNTVHKLSSKKKKNLSGARIWTRSPGWEARIKALIIFNPDLASIQ